MTAPGKLDESLREAGLYMLELVRAALQNTPAKPKPERVPWQTVYLMAAASSLDVLAYYGLLQAPEKPDEESMKLWKKNIWQTVIRQTQLDEDRAFLSRLMDEQGIDYLPMKGAYIQTLYPKREMRQMSDNDILYRLHENPQQGLKGASQKVMKELMEKAGARVISTDGIVDVFLLGQTSLFEMHREFLGPDQPLHDYFDQTWNRAGKCSDGCGEYSLSAEDHYILMLAHSWKHFRSGGCGPREIVDAWQYRQSLENAMNEDYVAKQLKLTGLSEYEALLRRLGRFIFEEGLLCQEDQERLDYFLGSGTYGNRENAIRNALVQMEEEGKTPKEARNAYLWKRLFPEKAYLETHFPFFSRHRWLIGFLLIYRGTRALFVRRKAVSDELRNLKKVSGKEDHNSDNPD